MAEQPKYGGQAVIEGVMIHGQSRIATACRLKDGSITVRHDEVDTLTRRYRWLRLAFIRGMPALIDSLRTGYRSLMWSADLALEGEEQQKPQAWQLVLTFIGALAFGIGLFVLLPTYALKFVFPGHETAAAGRTIVEQLLPHTSALLPNFIEGVVRVFMLVGYILAIRFNHEIKRVFAYHGAEHKVVNAWEASAPLTVEGAKPFSRIHPRCGTSFLFLVFVVGILMHALVGWQVWWLRLITRLLMLPLIAGVAYEVIRLAGRKRDSKLLRVLVWPGMALQQLTTAEPEDDQIEVALHSMHAVMEAEGVTPPTGAPDTAPGEQPAVA